MSMTPAGREAEPKSDRSVYLTAQVPRPVCGSTMYVNSGRDAQKLADVFRDVREGDVFRTVLTGNFGLDVGAADYVFD